MNTLHAKTVLFLLSLLLLGTASTSLAEKIAAEYGRPISIEDVTSIGDILASPEKYLAKTVLVRGLVVDVCAKRGCWIDVAAEDGSGEMQVKVDDGEIVFPMNARGKRVLVQGIVEELVIPADEMLAWYRHQAEEKGILFDPAKVPAEGGRIYRLRGLGARTFD